MRSPTGRRAALALAGAVMLAAAVALSVLAAREPRLPGDLTATRAIQGWPFPGTSLADLVRAVTTTEAVLGTGAVVAAGLWLAGARRPALALALALVVLPLAQQAVKQLVDRPRPTADLVDLRAGFSSPSFPSGHVMSPTLLYGFVLYLCWPLRSKGSLPSLPRGLALAAALLSTAVLALTGLVNVFLGVHWPSDVLGGYLWGAVLLALSIEAAGPRPEGQS